VLGLGVAACGGSRDHAPRLIDDRTGAYDGVPLGSGRAGVVRILGNPEREGPDEAGLPTDAETAGETGPTAIPMPAEPRGRNTYTALRYPQSVFFVDRTHVVATLVTDRGARTTRGVRIGDPLAKVRTAYRDRRKWCGKVEPGEGSSFVACTVRLGPHLHAWFGEDPIESITVASVPFGDYSPR